MPSHQPKGHIGVYTCGSRVQPQSLSVIAKLARRIVIDDPDAAVGCCADGYGDDDCYGCEHVAQYQLAQAIPGLARCACLATWRETCPKTMPGGGMKNAQISDATASPSCCTGGGRRCRCRRGCRALAGSSCHRDDTLLFSVRRRSLRRSSGGIAPVAGRRTELPSGSRLTREG
jgi:hypothetical protein